MKNSKLYTSSMCSIFCLVLLTGKLFSQPMPPKSASELKIALEKLNVLGSVLYVGAHPDDENTAFLSYCSSGRLLKTGYLSLTRGDGGQNLIGTEQGEELSVLRTQELLDARRIDGAEQFFSRAIDFGYSKSAEETIRFWGEDKVLSDVVWVIRKFRPDIIVTRFPTTGEGGHGNHTASAIFAEKAFGLAADPTAFPEQLKYVKTWQAKRLYWNGWLRAIQGRKDYKSKLVKIDLGAYNPVIGKSYTEIAVESRNMHRSQGVGASGNRGENINYFELMKGTQPGNGLFADIDQSWKRIPGSYRIEELLNQANKEFDIEKPEKIVPILLKAYSEMEKVKDDYWVPLKEKELIEVIRSCAGIWIESIASDYSTVPGGKLKVTAGIVNRSALPFVLKNLKFSYGEQSFSNVALKNQQFQKFETTLNTPKDLEITEPYWLANQHGFATYTVNDQQLIGSPQNENQLIASFTLSLNGQDIILYTPVYYRWTDPVRGEKYRPVEIRPAVSINLESKVYYFPGDNKRNIKVKLTGNADNVTGKLSLQGLPGWIIEPKSIAFSIKEKGNELTETFTVRPPQNYSVEQINAEAETNYGITGRGIEEINYPHIPVQTLFPPSTAKFIRLDIKKFNNNIGYIMGSGDLIPDILKELGYNVTLLSDEELDNGDLSRYDVIISGVRAYNTRPRLEADQKRLMKFVDNGGTYIVQYNTNFNLVTDNIGPYPFHISRDRITVEDSPVKFVNPDHQLLNFPNKILQSDFNDWIQERGLHFADTWDKNYETVLSGNDLGDAPLEGGLLFSHYGKGIFIYMGYAWFRQLPAGVPGAVKLFINLLSSGNYNKTK